MTPPSSNWLQEHPAACRDSTNSLRPPPIRMVKKHGVRKLTCLTRREHFCPHCPRAPYGSHDNGCIFASPIENESADWKIAKPIRLIMLRESYQARKFYSDQDLIEVVATHWLAKGNLIRISDLRKSCRKPGWRCIRDRFGGIRQARQNAKAWLQEEEKWDPKLEIPGDDQKE